MDTTPPFDQDACYRAILTRDARFDGRFFGCVKTTGIYCRPVCPARTPKRQNIVFVVSAAAAQDAGFRACLRCRPETAPDMGAWRGTSNTVSRALSLIEAGALDMPGCDVDALASRLGVGERQLRRLFQRHLGAAPVSVAQTRRVLLAKSLIHQTDLSMAQVALASGFGSVRRFNETFQALYDRPPSALRRRQDSIDAASTGFGGGVKLKLPFRAPYDLADLLSALAERGDEVFDGRWSRPLSILIDATAGHVTVQAADANSLSVTVAVDDLRALPGILARVRRVFDLSADPQAIAADLSRDPALAPLVAARPGLRIAGHWIDDDSSPPSDRWTNPALPDTARTETWRPWRAYAQSHLRAAGATPFDLQETRHARHAA